MNRNRRYRFLSGLAISLSLINLAHAQEQSLPAYVPQNHASGTLTSIGSDTMVYVVSYWVVGFKRFHPDVQTRILQAGSATAPPALLDGTATIGPMSRRMKDGEIQAFVNKFGYPPTEFRVAMDALAVYVHKDNPLQGMTLPQVDAVFSSTRKCGYLDDITLWGQLGLDNAWRTHAIELYGRNTLSGTYAFFADHALCKGKFKGVLQMQPTSWDVVRAVAATPDAIGYSGIGYRTRDVRAIPLATRAGEPFVPATADNVYSGKYPLSRYLYVYVNKAPGRPLPVLEREFLRMVFSAQGQSMVTNNGFVPLSAEVLREELAKLD